MPFNIGQIKIEKQKMDIEKLSENLITGEGPKLRIDWHNTKKYNKKIYHLNDNRENHKYQIRWSFSRIPNKKYYSYIPTRKIKRTLASILKNNPEIDYLFA